MIAHVYFRMQVTILLKEVLRLQHWLLSINAGNNNCGYCFTACEMLFHQCDWNHLLVSC